MAEIRNFQHAVEESRRVRCFMDGIDWQHHLDADAHGTKIYPSEDAVRRGEKCVTTGGCGIVEVEVRLIRWVERQELVGMTAQPGTPETDADPANPNPGLPATDPLPSATP